MSEPVIQILDLVKFYKEKRGRKVHALNNLKLSVYPGEVYGFLGPNGSGKSTTIKTLMGLLSPDSGTVSLFGQTAGMAATRQRVGYLPENPALYDFLTGTEFLNFIGTSFRMTKEKIAVESDRVLALVELTDAAKRSIRGYSKGMVQRLGIAQALLHDPDLYVLDEPMSGLDPIGRALVKDIILDLKQRGKTVFFSTHVTADVERVCDRIGVIVGGELQAERQVSELLREGIDGYYCRVRGVTLPESLLKHAVDCGNSIIEVFISRAEFDHFARRVVKQGGSFELLEPRRRDVEDFFLSLVRDKEEQTCV